MVAMHLVIKKQINVLFVENPQHTKLAIMDSVISIGKKPLDGKASDKKATNATKEYIENKQRQGVEQLPVFFVKSNLHVFELPGKRQI